MFYKSYFWITTFLLLISCFTIDDSDKDFFTRSDIAIKTDYLTGCQYLTTSWGGITPRLDKYGKQVCIKRTVNNAR